MCKIMVLHNEHMYKGHLLLVSALLGLRVQKQELVQFCYCGCEQGTQLSVRNIVIYTETTSEG